MKKITLFSLAIIVWMITLTTACRKDKPSAPVVDRLSLEINQFIWNGLSNYYLWTDSVSNLSQTTYADTNKLNSFLVPFSDHEKLFNSLLYPTRDHWSWIVPDYTVLEKEFQGISKSFGFDFGLVSYGNGVDVFGYVRYVVKNSPASKAGLKRGDIFTKVNGTSLDTVNYQSVLSNTTTYTLGMATISDSTVIPNSTQIQVTAIELAEDPILLDTVYTINNINIGYLVYNQFVANYDLELNNVFQYFKDQNVQQLILDLRYNPGGSVQSAKYLSSMIYTTNTSQVILKTQYNNFLEYYLSSKYGTGYFNQYFANNILSSGTDPSAAINSLGLSKLCVITSHNTASASELVINALKAYIPVSVIGTHTVGKYVASITVYDYSDNGVYDSVAGGIVNASHKYAMQPIILKIANANGKSNFYNGFTPDYVISEYSYLANLHQFGDIQEPLLKAAINYVLGLPQTKSGIENSFVHIADSRERLPHYNEMYFLPRDLKFNNPAFRLHKK